MDPAAISPCLGVLRFAAAMMCVLACTPGLAVAPDWLPVRDQNPFVRGSGLPLPPQVPHEANSWDVGAYVAEGNSQLISATAGNVLVFAAETRETRITASYAFDEHWSLRASLGDVWIGSGFLDGPIRRFHNLIGAPQGYRGELAVHTPFIRFVHDGTIVYQLDHSGHDAGPVLADLTRTWSVSERQDYGITFGAKAPLGSSRHLSDTGGSGVSVSAFTDLALSERMQFGA